jgi:hypothetical protein
MRTHAAVLSLLIGLAVVAPVSAGERDDGLKGDLPGQLVNPDTEQPVVGAKVLLVDPGEYSATTDRNGHFVIQNVPVGRYKYLFAFVRRDQNPDRSMLVARNVLVRRSPVEIRLKMEPVMDRAREQKPEVARTQFDDQLSRRFAQPIVVVDPLGLDWPEEYVSYTVTFGAQSCWHASLRVIDGQSGREVPFQLGDIRYGAGSFIRSCTVTFPASLPHPSPDTPPEDRVYIKSYALCSDWQDRYQMPQFPTDLKTETLEATGQQVMSNDRMAVRLPPKTGSKALPAADCPAPILAVRGPDGVWFGEGRLVSDREVESFECKETAEGPIFKEFRVTYHLTEVKGETEEDTKPAAVYQVTIRLYKARSYVLVTEEMQEGLDLAFEFSIRSNLNPDRALLVRDGEPVFEALSTPPDARERILAVFRPWNPPGVRRSHNWYGVYSSGNRKDAVGIVQVGGSVWAFRDKRGWYDGSWLITDRDDDDLRLVATPKPDLVLKAPCRAGTRQWALAVFDKRRNWDAASLAQDPAPPAKSHVLNRLHVRLSQINIRRLRELRLSLSAMTETPKLLFNEHTYGTLKDTYEEDSSRIPELLHDVFSGSRNHTAMLRDRILSGVIALQHAFVGRQNDKAVTGWCGRLTDPDVIEPIVKYVTLLYDANVKSGLFTRREKDIIMATLALAAGQYQHPNYAWSLSHDPVASARRDCAVVMASLLVDKHPESSTRILEARNPMRRVLGQAGATGGVPLDTGAVVRAMNLWAETAPAFQASSGSIQVGESPLRWPDFVSTLAHLAALTMPPDRRYGGARLLPSLGRSRAGDRSLLGVMGVTAARYAESSPELAGRFAWAWHQAGRPVFGRLTRHQSLLNLVQMVPSELSGEPPAGVDSRLLPGFGVLMRANFNEPDEAYLLFKCSRFPYSLHRDQGGLIFHAFGAPVLVDPGSPPPRQATWSHNTVRIDGRPHSAPGRLTHFASLDDEDYAAGRFPVETLSRLTEYTPPELEAMRAEAAAAKKPFVLPPGHRADGGVTYEMLPTPDELDTPVIVDRHVLLDKRQQYLVVLDRVTGSVPSDVFFNVCAEQARLEGDLARFAGPVGVDVNIHAFGSHDVKAQVFRDGPQRWVLRLSQAPPARKPETEAETEDEGPAEKAEPPAQEAEPPTVQYLTVVCPSRRALPGETDVREYAPPSVEKLDGITGLRITYGRTVRYIFLSEETVEFRSPDGAYFKGTRGLLTLRPTHFDVVLLDAGKMLYKGKGVKINHGMARFRFMPNYYVDGEVSGMDDKWLTFYNLGRSMRSLSFKTDGVEFNPRGSSDRTRYGVKPGNHTVTIEPE